MYKKFFLKVLLTAFTLALFTQGAQAVSTAKSGNGTAVLDVDFLKEKISKVLGLTVTSVEATPMPGVAILFTEQGLFYASYDGEFFIQGKLYSLTDTVTDLSEVSLAKMRLAGIKSFEDDMIIYKAKDEKYVVTVFTDITCGYCRKMHAQMADYNARGITFRYLAYPRAGINDQLGNLSQGFKDLRSVWCSDDTAKALTDAKSGKTVAAKTCNAPIEAQLNFGRQIGVNGTPAIILSNGTMAPGYIPPAKLESILKDI